MEGIMLLTKGVIYIHLPLSKNNKKKRAKQINMSYLSTSVQAMPFSSLLEQVISKRT